MRSPRLSPPRRTLAFGPWHAELAGDEVVDVCFGSRSILRGMRAVIRDDDWRTLTPAITEMEDRSTDDELVSRLGIRYSGWGQTYTSTVTLTLRSDSLRMDFHGRADAAFRGNRVGLVVLHHPDDAGTQVSVTSPSGEQAAARFPEEISPHQPLMNIAGLEWHRDGVNVRLQFGGDVFETEDQRNWTDASFKTYGTPLARSFPVAHPAGSEVVQSVTVTVSGDGSDGSAETRADGARAGASSAAPLRAVVEADVVGRVPPIGVAYGDSGADATNVQAIAGLESLLVELEGPLETRARRASAATALAERLDTRIDLRIVAASGGELAATLDLLDLNRVRRMAVYDPASHVTEPPLWHALTAEAARRGFEGDLVAGTRAHFTELNRTIERLPPDAAGVTFSITPQMHAREVERIVQTLPMQTLVLQNARRLAGDRSLHIGPITLRPRFNAVATSSGGSAIAAEDATDELQADAFTAAWTLGSIAALSGGSVEPGEIDGPAASVSYFEMFGARGIDDADGGPYPVGRLLRALAPLAGADVLRVTGHADGLVVYPVRTAADLTVFIANLDDSQHALELTLPAQTDATGIRIVDFSASEDGVLPAGARVTDGSDGGGVRVSMDRFTAVAVTLQLKEGTP